MGTMVAVESNLVFLQSHCLNAHYSTSKMQMCIAGLSSNLFWEVRDGLGFCRGGFCWQGTYPVSDCDSTLIRQTTRLSVLKAALAQMKTTRSWCLSLSIPALLSGVRWAPVLYSGSRKLVTLNFNAHCVWHHYQLFPVILCLISLLLWQCLLSLVLLINLIFN